jgi:putative FmdB family regulatory protein
VPIYEYRCPVGHTFEVFQRMSDPPADRCEVCSASPVEKVLFPVAVHFKGSGFYSTDYGRGSRKSADKDGDSGDRGSGKSEGTEKKDAKPSASDATPKKTDSDTS